MVWWIWPVTNGMFYLQKIGWSPPNLAITLWLCSKLWSQIFRKLLNSSVFPECVPISNPRNPMLAAVCLAWVHKPSPQLFSFLTLICCKTEHEWIKNIQWYSMNKELKETHPQKLNQVGEDGECRAHVHVSFQWLRWKQETCFSTCSLSLFILVFFCFLCSPCVSLFSPSFFLLYLHVLVIVHLSLSFLCRWNFLFPFLSAAL